MTPHTEKLYRAWQTLANREYAPRAEHITTLRRRNERIRVAKLRFEVALARDKGIRYFVD